MQTPGTHTFQATNLHIRSFGGKLRVEPWENGEKTIVVTLSGSEERIKAVEMLAHRGELVVEDSRASEGDGSGTTISIGGGSVSIRSSSGSTVSNIRVGGMNVVNHARVGTMIVTGKNNVGISMDGDGIKINGVKVEAVAGAPAGAEPLSAVIRVPVGCSVAIDELFEEAEIGDTLGPLSVAILGGADLKAGRVRATSLRLQGGGDVRIKEVQESLAIQLMGSSDVAIAGGTVDSIAINVMGSGDVRFAGTAKNGSVVVMGSGDVRVGKVTGHVSKSCMGSGDIRLG